MPVWKGPYSPDYKEGSLGGDLNWMPSSKPYGVPVRDTQAKTPGRQQIIDDTWGDFSGPMRKKN